MTANPLFLWESYVVAAIFESVVGSTDTFDEPHQHRMFVRQADSEVCLKGKLDASGHVLKNLHTFFRSAICLMISDRRIR